MKKIFTILVLLLLAIPVVGKAESYSVEQYGLKITVPDDWEVLTRDNLKNNPILEKYNITYDDMNSSMQEQHIYIDSIKGNIEVFVRIKSNDVVYNLSNYSDDELEEFKEALKLRTKAEEYSLLKSNSLTFLKTYYKDQSLGYYLAEYYTIINGEGVTLTAQKKTPFTDFEKEEIEVLTKSIEVPVKEGFEKEPNHENPASNVIKFVIIGAFIGGIAGYIFQAVKKSKNN